MDAELVARIEHRNRLVWFEEHQCEVSSAPDDWHAYCWHPPEREIMIDKSPGRAILPSVAMNPRAMWKVLLITRSIQIIFLFWIFLGISQGESVNMIIVIGGIYFAISGTAAIVAKYTGLFTGVTPIYLDVVYYLTAFTILFMAGYWNCGGAHNFNIHLTRLDAAYFTIGTLSTAGTGNIVATSELARALQAWQMALDMVFLLVAVALVMTRLGSVRRRTKDSDRSVLENSKKIRLILNRSRAGSTARRSRYAGRPRGPA